jgi:hypothetical protein
MDGCGWVPPLILSAQRLLAEWKNGAQNVSRMAPPLHLTVGGWMANPKSGFALSYAVTSPKSEIPRALAMENSKLKTQNSKLKTQN